MSQITVSVVELEPDYLARWPREPVDGYFWSYADVPDYILFSAAPSDLPPIIVPFQVLELLARKGVGDSIRGN